MCDTIVWKFRFILWRFFFFSRDIGFGCYPHGYCATLICNFSIKKKTLQKCSISYPHLASAWKMHRNEYKHAYYASPVVLEITCDISINKVIFVFIEIMLPTCNIGVIIDHWFAYRLLKKPTKQTNKTNEQQPSIGPIVF